MKPAVWLLAASSNLVLRVFGDTTSFTESRLSAEEIRHMVEDATRTGAVDPTVGDITSRAIELATLDAADVMVHRKFVTFIHPDSTLEDARRLLVAAGHDAAPVSDVVQGDTLGYVTLRDLVVDVAGAPESTVRGIVRPACYVPESMPTAELVRELQRRRARLAVVVDEHGGTVGIVTIEDLLEELLGEIVGDHDKEPTARIHREDDGTALVDGIVPVRAVNRELGLRLPRTDEAVLIGGLCSLLAGGRIPAVGEQVTSPDGSVLTAMDVSPRRVRLVHVRPPDPVEH
jgi:putative hemolysin